MLRIFAIDNYGETQNLVVYNNNSLKEMFYAGAAYVKCRKADFEKYIAAKLAAEDEDFAYKDCTEWFEVNGIDYRCWVEEFAAKEDFACESDEVIVYDNEVVDQSNIAYDLVYSYFNGSNHILKTVIDAYGDSAYEVTENYPGLTFITAIKGYYEDGEWYEYGTTGQYDIYKDDLENWYIVDSSYYQGSLDYIKPIDLDELIQKFGEDEFEGYTEKYKE